MVSDDDDDFWSLPPPQGPRTSLLFRFSLRSFVLVGLDSCPPYPSTAYLYLYSLYMLSLSLNTGMFDKKNKQHGGSFRYGASQGNRADE